MVRTRSFSASLLVFLCVLFLSGLALTRIAHAQTQPVIRYSAATRTIYLGDPYDAARPAEAPYVGYPSHPNAPKLTMTIPQLAAALGQMGQASLLIEQAKGIWLLKANIVINQNSKLEISKSLLSELRLESYPLNGQQKVFQTMIAAGGHLYINGVRVHSWNTQTQNFDTSYELGRSYLSALNGGRMDIIDAEASYLGWRDPNPRLDGGQGKGEPSGLAWKRRATESQLETGPTGSIINSKIHHNYYGNYTWQTYGLVLTGNQVYANGYYGFDPHDDSMKLEIAYNEFYDNAGHGLILSRRCIDNRIHHNKFYNNKKHGFMLDRGSDNNFVYANEAYNNGYDGMSIFESSNNLFTNNLIYNNQKMGVRLSASYDSTDPYDGLTIDNIFEQNSITGNGEHGVMLYERADRNSFATNIVSNNGGHGFSIRTGGNTLTGNTIAANGSSGIYVLGGPPIVYTPGETPIVPAIDTPGHANYITRNLLQTNANNGLELINSATDTKALGNRILDNKANGVLVQGTKSQRNYLLQNNISNNTLAGIALQEGAHLAIAAPIIVGESNRVVQGQAAANARVEIYRDPNGEGLWYLGATVADSQGVWRFTLPANDSASNGRLTALAIDQSGNTSAFSGAAIAATSPLEQGYRLNETHATQPRDRSVEEQSALEDPSTDVDRLQGDFIDISYDGETVRRYQRLFLPMVIDASP
jgi:parallel beta-helix repeat protein